jgi:hypothetical protein
VLLSDQQITGEKDKKPECKIFEYRGDRWSMVFTYAGNVVVAKEFGDRFKAYAATKLKAPANAEQVRTGISRILSSTAALDGTSGSFQLLCGIAVNSESVLVKTDQRAVRGMDANRSYSFIGYGETELVHYLAPLFTRTNTFTTEQAFSIGVYLAAQVEKYVRDCSGPTDAIILKPTGAIERKTHYQTSTTERFLLSLDRFVAEAASAFFDMRVPENEFEGHLDFLGKQLREIRASLPLPASAKLRYHRLKIGQ